MKRGAVLQRELRVLNQKEDRDLQLKLDLLDKQYRYTSKMLRRRRDGLTNEQRRVVMVKGCEPKATVNIAMKEIGEHMNAGTHFRGSHTSHGRRHTSSKPRCQDEGPLEPSRSVSAPPPPPVKTSGSVRRRGNVQSSLSFMQMKNIATIDSISEKEAAKQQWRVREDTERLRLLQRETLHQRVTAFINTLQDQHKNGMIDTTSTEQVGS